MNISRRAYKYRTYPTIEQKQLLARSFGCVRMVYNDTLRYRTDAFYKDNIKVIPSEAEKRLVELKKQISFLKRSICCDTSTNLERPTASI